MQPKPPTRITRPVLLRREILAILAIKLVLIVTIKLAFFSDPIKPGSEGVAAALLSPSVTQSLSARSQPHE